MKFKATLVFNHNKVLINTWYSSLEIKKKFKIIIVINKRLTKKGLFKK